MKRLRSFLYGNIFIAILGCTSLNASIIYSFTSETAGPTAGTFDWQYTANLSADQKLDASATDFAVVYDFNGIISASTSNVASGLTLTNIIENSTTPQPTSQGVADSATIGNVRTVIAGTLTPGALTPIYTIDIISSLGTGGGSMFQSGQALKNSPGDPANGSVTGNTAIITGPSAAPEPTTMVLFGSALIGVGFIRRRRKA